MRQNQMRKTLLGLLTGGALIACGSAWGGTLPAPAAAPCIPAGQLSISVATFASFGTAGCSEGDKNYTWLGNSANIDSAAIAISELPLQNGDLQHTLLLVFNGNVGEAAPFAASLDYTVEMNDLATDLFVGIDFVRFDTTTGLFTGETGLSQITPNNGQPVILLTSQDGNPSATTPTVGEPTQLKYNDSWLVTGQGSLLTSADSLIETSVLNVPEPASLALVGLGLTALGFVRRRKTS